MRKICTFIFILSIANACYSQVWSVTEKIVAPNRVSLADYGTATVVSGNRMIVGAPQDPLDASGANSIANAGAAYIYERDLCNGWTLVQKIVASDRGTGSPIINGWFGYSVSISGDYAIVGSKFFGEAAYIFERNASGVWIEVQKLSPPEGNLGRWFGRSVSISGNYAIVGEPKNRNDEFGAGASLVNAGAVFVYKRNSSGLWVFTQKLVANDRATNTEFSGYDAVGENNKTGIFISGNDIIVGAPGEQLDASGANSLNNAGAVYTFKLDTTTGVWNQTQKLVNSDRATMDRFGGSVSIDSNYLVVGTTGKKTDVSGGNPITAAGAAYIFKRNNTGTWNQVQKIVAPVRAFGDIFGHAVSISNNYLVVGASKEDEDASELNPITEAGSAYIFERDTITNNWNLSQKIVAPDRLVGAPSGGGFFGESASISGNYIVLGARQQDFDALGTNQINNAGAAYIFNTVNTATTITTQNPTICQGTSFTLPDGSTTTSSGTFTDTLTTSAGCDSVIITNLIVTPMVTTTQNPIICQGDNFTLPSGVTVNSAGTFTDTLAASTGCDSIIITNLTVNSNIIAIINPTTTSGATPLNVFFGNGSTTGFGITYNWSFGDGNTNTQFEPSYTYTTIGTYIVTLTVSDGICFSSTSITIEVFEESAIIVPNVFTPNSDGFNDVFTVNGMNLKSVKGEIFNRWGQKLFTWNNILGSWNGKTTSGDNVPNGTYFYVINAIGNDDKHYLKKGTVSLFRD